MRAVRAEVGLVLQDGDGVAAFGQIVAAQEDVSYSAEPSFWVIIKDYEQESCFILMFWAFAILGYKALVTLEERALLQRELIPVREGVRILPEDTREYARTLQALPDSEPQYLDQFEWTRT